MEGKLVIIVKDGDGTNVLSGDDPRQVKALALAASGIGPATSEFEEDALKGIEELQREFQEKYCSGCIEYDPKKGCFKKMGRPNNSQDCYYHLTDVLGTCYNYRKRK